MSLRNHTDLDVWKRAIEFVTSIYKATQEYPKEELYGLVSQLRRSAISIPSNIAEGATRQSTKEFIHFLYIALGSASEVDVQLVISRNLDYLLDKNFIALSAEREEISRMLSGLIKSLRSRK
ncbi:MAG: four helix bundle protein [Pseudomonadota bacterium]